MTGMSSTMVTDNSTIRYFHPIVANASSAGAVAQMQNEQKPKYDTLAPLLRSVARCGPAGMMPHKAPWTWRYYTLDRGLNLTA